MEDRIEKLFKSLTEEEKKELRCLLNNERRKIRVTDTINGDTTEVFSSVSAFCRKYGLSDKNISRNIRMGYKINKRFIIEYL